MTFPTFQAAGAVAESATVSISPAWPTHVANDIGLLLIEAPDNFNFDDLKGFRPLPVVPSESAIGGVGTAVSRLHVLWKRATSGAEPAPTIQFKTDHVRAMIITFRGCAATGSPFNAMAGGFAPAASTAVSCPAVTTTQTDQLIVNIVSGSQPVDSSTQFSAWANAALANITERVDSASIIGNGSAFGVATGEKAVAGACGNTTATSAQSTNQGYCTLALSATANSTDTTPYLAYIGAAVERATAGTIAPAWPAEHVAGDVALLFVETGGWPLTFANAQGFVEIANSPKDAGSSGASSATGLHIFWKRATGSAEAAPTIDFIAEHIRAVIMTFRNVIASGDSWDVTSGGIVNPGSTAISIPGATTTKANTLVVAVGSHSRDIASADEARNWANADLENVLERYDSCSTIGSGSGLFMAAGQMPAPGTYGNTTGFLASTSLMAGMTIALKGAGGGITLVAATGSFGMTGNSANLLRSRLLTAATGVFNMSGQAVTFAIFINRILTAEPGTFNLTGNDVTLRKLIKGWVKRDRRTDTWIKRPPKA